MKWLREKWDWWIYRRAFASVKRLFNGNSGIMYLLELHLRDLRSEHKMPERLRASAEGFRESMKRLGDPIVDKNGASE